MTDQEINLAIAEACPTLFQIIGRETHWRICCEGEDSRVRICDDLNAMHEAEKVLADDCPYREALVAVCKRDFVGQYFTSVDCIRATARQRAEAFLRTLGKWPVTKQAALDKSPPA